MLMSPFGSLSSGFVRDVRPAVAHAGRASLAAPVRVPQSLYSFGTTVGRYYLKHTESRCILMYESERLPDLKWGGRLCTHNGIQWLPLFVVAMVRYYTEVR